MNDTILHEIVARVAVESRKEKLLLLEIPDAKNKLIEIICDTQVWSNNRRISAVDLANTVTEISRSEKVREEFLDMVGIDGLSLARWNCIRDMGEKSQSKEAKKWKAQVKILTSAREELILEMLPEIKSRLFKKFHRTHMEIDEMVNDAVIGVIRAAEKYKPEFGRRFVYYSHSWIDARIYEMWEKRAQITGGTSMMQVRYQIKNARLKIEQEYGRPATKEEIIDEAGITEEAYNRSIFIFKSLDSPTDFGDVDENPEYETVIGTSDARFDDIDNAPVAERINEVLMRLSETERAISLFRLPDRDCQFEVVKPIPIADAIMHLKRTTTRDLIEALESEKVA